MCVYEIISRPTLQKEHQLTAAPTRDQKQNLQCLLIMFCPPQFSEAKAKPSMAKIVKNLSDTSKLFKYLRLFSWYLKTKSRCCTYCIYVIFFKNLGVYHIHLYMKNIFINHLSLFLIGLEFQSFLHALC